MSVRTRFGIAIIALCLYISSVSFASDYRRTTASHFAFYFHPGDERLAGSLIDKAEGMRGGIVEDLGFDFKGITQVYLAPSARRYQEMQPGGWVPSWSAGVAYPSLNLIILKSPRAIKRGHIDLEKVLKHELTHIAVGRAFQGREEVPRWLDEGLAMYESREWNVSRVSSIMYAVLTKSLIPLSEITHTFPHHVNRVKLAYAESFYLVSFLLNKHGKDSFHEFIRQCSRGKSLEDALRNVYAMRWEEFEDAWHAYLRVRFSWLPIITSASTLWFFTTLAFVLAYVKKNKAARLKYQEWEQEDAAATASNSRAGCDNGGL